MSVITKRIQKVNPIKYHLTTIFLWFSYGFPMVFHKVPGEIVFLIQLREGVVFVDYLSSYSNIGTATCQLEDMEQKPLGPEVKIDPGWWFGT